MPQSDLNPRFIYVTGGTMPPNAASYVERKADYDLLAALLEGEYCYLLDTRQMGKSSLMVRTGVKLRDHGVDTVVLDLSAIGQNVTADRWYAGLLARLGAQLDIEDELIAYWRERQELGGLQRFVEGIRKALVHLDRPLVIFLDEIDAVRSLPFSTDEFFIAIRECYNRRTTDPLFERLSFCLIGVATPTDLIRDTRLSPFNIGRRIVLEDFTSDEAALLAQGLAGKKSVLDRVLYWTGGHPYLTQKLCRVMAEQPRSGASGDVDRLCTELFLTHQARESDDNLAFVRNRLLTNEADPTALLELYGRVCAGKRVADDDTNPLCSVVKLSGVVRVENGALRVRNRIYAQVFDRSWVVAHLPDAEVRRQRRAFRRGLVLAGASAGVVLALVGGLAWMAIRNAELANAQAQMAKAQRYQAETERDAAQDLAYVADMNLIPQSYEQNDIGRVQNLLDETRTSKYSKYRGFEWGYWNRLSHRDLLTLPEHSTGMDLLHGIAMMIAAFSPDGKRIVTGSTDGTVKVWDAATGREMLTLGAAGSPPPHQMYTGSVKSVAFSPDGKRIFTGTWDGGAKVWDAVTGRETLTVKGQKGKSEYGAAVAFSPDGKRIVAGSGDHMAKVFDAATGRETLTLQGFSWPVHSAAFSPDGKRIVTGSETGHFTGSRIGAVQIWDAATGREMLTLTRHSDQVCSVAFSPDGKRIVAGFWDGNAKVWDAATGREMLTLKGRFRFVTSVAFSPDGKQIVTGCGDPGIWTGTAIVWDAATGSEMLTLKGHRYLVMSAAFSPDGKRIVTASADGTAKVWDVAASHETLTIKGDIGFAEVALSPDGKQIVTGSWDDTAKVWTAQVWDAATGHETITLRGHSNRVISTAFSPDSKRIVTGSADKTAKVWDAVTGRETVTLKGHSGEVRAAAFSPDGERIVTGSKDGTAKIWDAVTGHETVTIKEQSEYTTSEAFSPDGKRIVAGSGENMAKVWDAATGHEMLTLKGHSSYVRSAAFSADGTRIVTGSADGTAKVWDATTGHEMLTLKGHSSEVRAVTFSPDGKRIVTGSMDGTAKVWEAATGHETLTLKGHSEEVFSVAFSPDGKRIVTGSRDKTIRVWSAATGR